jgi:hypothetical protein
MVRSGGTVAQVKATVRWAPSITRETITLVAVKAASAPPKERREVRLGLGRVNLHYRRIKPATCNSTPACPDASGACVEKFILYNAKSPADDPGANPAAGLIDPSMTAIGADEEATMPYLSEWHHAASISLPNIIIDVEATLPAKYQYPEFAGSMV